MSHKEALPSELQEELETKRISLDAEIQAKEEECEVFIQQKVRELKDFEACLLEAYEQSLPKPPSSQPDHNPPFSSSLLLAQSPVTDYELSRAGPVRDKSRKSSMASRPASTDPARENSPRRGKKVTFCLECEEVPSVSPLPATADTRLSEGRDMSMELDDEHTVRSKPRYSLAEEEDGEVFLLDEAEPFSHPKSPIRRHSSAKYELPMSSPIDRETEDDSLATSRFSSSLPIAIGVHARVLPEAPPLRVEEEMEGVTPRSLSQRMLWEERKGAGGINGL
jgi:hypothetical protein